MLSQQIALFYFADSWLIEDDGEIKKRYKNSKKEFWQALRTLSSHKGNTEIINNKLKVVKILFKYETKGFKLNKVFVDDFFDITNELQEKMDVITKLYEAIE